MTLGQHLVELRKRISIAALAIVVFSIREQGNLARVLAGEGVQTIVKKGQDHGEIR